MKIVVPTGQGRVLNAAILQIVFDGAAYSHGARHEKHLLSRLFFTADSSKELIQIVEHFHVRLSLVLINCPIPARSHLAVRAKKYRGVKEEGKAWIMGGL